MTEKEPYIDTLRVQADDPIESANLETIKQKYTVTRICSLSGIFVEAENDKELMELYHEGTVDEILSTLEKNEFVKYVIKDKNGKIIFEHTYT